MTKQVNQETLKAMRDWISDCIGCWDDVTDEDDVEALTDDQVIDGIERHYSGGVDGFVRDSEPVFISDRKPSGVRSNEILAFVFVSFGALLNAVLFVACA